MRRRTTPREASAVMIQWLEDVWKDFSRLFQRKEKPFKVSHREELPDKPQRGTLYAIGEGTPWALAFLCPCGCGGADSAEPPQSGSTELENASRPKEPTHTHAFCLANRRLPFTFHSARRTYHLVQKICALSLPTGGLPIQPAKI